MKRYRDDRPGDIVLARGTFNAHPYVMGAMSVFLERLAEPEALELYRDLDQTWTARAEALNRRLAEKRLPIAVANMSTVWSVLYTKPSRFNWMLQYYLRRHGINLSWVGTGRLIFSLNFTDRDYDGFCDRFIAAADAMAADGWWWRDEAAVATRPTIKRQVLREMVRHGLLRRA
jgi:glutamate-1-semialdehyde 2,1-aminomutase